MRTMREIRETVYINLMIKRNNIICHECLVKCCCSKLCPEFIERFKSEDYRIRLKLKRVDLKPGTMFWSYVYKKEMMNKLSIKQQ